MGCINEEDIPSIKTVLDDISKNFSLFRLQATDLEAEIIPSGKKVSVLVLENPGELQRLHETVMQKLWKYLSYDVEISMLFNPPEVKEETLFWIKNYANKYDDPSLFDPHITVGFGETDKFRMPVDFTASALALCHLGNYNTCRKVIFSFDL
jgi:hypothetical protein